MYEAVKVQMNEGKNKKEHAWVKASSFAVERLAGASLPCPPRSCSETLVIGQFRNSARQERDASENQVKCVNFRWTGD